MDAMVAGKRVEIRLSADQVGAVDEWRRQQEDLPPRAEAIVRLMEMSLEGAKPGKPKTKGKSK